MKFVLSSVLILTLGVPDVAMAQAPPWKAPSRAARKQNPVAASADSIAAGAAVYQRECLSCHGTSGIGDGPAAKDLEKHPGDLTSQVVSDQSDGALFWKLTMGRAPMPTFSATLSVEQRWQVVNFIRTFGGEPEPVPPRLEASATCRRALSAVQAAYETVSASLAQRDDDAARAALPALGRAINALRDVEVEAELTETWHDTASSLAKAQSTLAGAESGEQLRDAFASFSDAAISAWQLLGHANPRPLVVLRCGDARGGRGARWVQLDNKPRNPYATSSADATCGQVEALLGAARESRGGNL